MSDHPFNGKWNSYLLSNTGQPVLDGEMMFDIAPNGHFNSGKHVTASVVEMEGISVLPENIHVKEKYPGQGEYFGTLIQDPAHQNRKITVGRYRSGKRHLAEKEVRESSEPEPQQDNGTWVATQP
jgi:hypothetical protein